MRMASANHPRRRDYSGSNHAFVQCLERCCVARNRVDLRQSLHDKAGVIMINKIAHPIHCIEPGAIGILILQNEVQVSFRDLRVVFIGENLRSTS